MRKTGLQNFILRNMEYHEDFSLYAIDRDQRRIQTQSNI